MSARQCVYPWHTKRAEGVLNVLYENLLFPDLCALRSALFRRRLEYAVAVTTGQEKVVRRHDDAFFGQVTLHLTVPDEGLGRAVVVCHAQHLYTTRWSVLRTLLKE